jgi:hypothetical protein
MSITTTPKWVKATSFSEIMHCLERGEIVIKDDSKHEDDPLIMEIWMEKSDRNYLYCRGWGSALWNQETLIAKIFSHPQLFSVPRAFLPPVGVEEMKGVLIEAAKAYTSTTNGNVTLNRPDIYKAYRDGQENGIQQYAQQLQQPSDIKKFQEELFITEKLLEERQKLLDAIPECPTHGKCVPHALEWIENQKSRQPAQGDVKWNSYPDEEPKQEGQYLCCNFWKSHYDDKFSYSVFVSNYKFYRMRETGELNPSDGINGCFSNDLGYASTVTHWMPLPADPNQSSTPQPRTAGKESG